MKQLINLTFVIAALFSVVLTVNAQTSLPLTAGCLDNSFGINGSVTTYVPGTLNLPSAKTVVQSDGKILAMADAHLNNGLSFTNVIIRYNADGSIDSAFGSGGFVYMNWNGANNSFGNAYAITLQQIGMVEKTIAAGSAKDANGNTILRVDRCNFDGSVDNTFGTNGSALVNAGYALTVTVQPDGKILTVGDVGVLVRLNADGTPDSSFGSNGLVQTSSLMRINALTVQSTGKIIAVGSSSVKGKNIMTVARFNANGTLDTSFGAAGKTAIDFNAAGSSGNAVKIDSSGKIIAAGAASRKSGLNDFAVARFTANGQLDTTFDGDGKATLDFNGSDSARKVELQANGKIVLIGSANNSGTGTQNFAMARYNPNGYLDTTFGQGGIVTTDFSGEWENIYDGAIQIDPLCNCEKIVAVGTVKISGQAYAVAARYLP